VFDCSIIASEVTLSYLCACVSCLLMFLCVCFVIKLGYKLINIHKHYAFVVFCVVVVVLVIIVDLATLFT